MPAEYPNPIDATYSDTERIERANEIETRMRELLVIDAIYEDGTTIEDSSERLRIAFPVNGLLSELQLTPGLVQIIRINGEWRNNKPVGFIESSMVSRNDDSSFVYFKGCMDPNVSQILQTSSPAAFESISRMIDGFEAIEESSDSTE